MSLNNVDRYWKQFQESLPPGAEPPQAYYESFSFGGEEYPEHATEIAALALNGTKTSTGELKWVYDADDKPLMNPGDLSIVTLGGDQPACIIETTEVRIVPFDEVDEQFAYEGWGVGQDPRKLVTALLRLHLEGMRPQKLGAVPENANGL